MAEWGGVLLIFWTLWGVDQLKVSRRDQFNMIVWGRRVRVGYGRLRFAGWWPGSWRALVADVPFSFSPLGITNRGAGQLARPTEGPAVAQVWRWDEIQSATTQKGWIWVNGARFCPDTGHLSPRELQAIAKKPELERRRHVQQLLARWIRPAHLRRRAKVLTMRTTWPAAFNHMLLLLLVVLTAYLARDQIPVPGSWVEVVTRALPLWLGYALLLHVAGVVLSWRATRQLRVRAQDGRGVALFSALMLPPQALRLRALVGTGFFPPQHPLSYILAFETAERRGFAFNVWADLRWAIGSENDPPLAREIRAWFGQALEEQLRPFLRAAGIEEEDLFARPVAESAACCRYCPRCRDQFIEARERCAHGVALLPLKKEEG